MANVRCRKVPAVPAAEPAVLQVAGDLLSLTIPCGHRPFAGPAWGRLDQRRHGLVRPAHRTGRGRSSEISDVRSGADEFHASVSSLLGALVRNASPAANE